jgi:hypothetical protein
MLKIVTTDAPTGGAVLRLEGQIIGPWVDELRRACEHRLGSGAVMLDLADVSFVERRGLDLLHVLRMRGVPLLHCSAFVTEQLKAQS